MRGFDADKVYEYLDLLADQVQATEKELSDTRAELKRVQAELYDYEHVGDRVNDQVVQMFSQAQLVAEEMVEDVSRDARERVSQARAREREIVEEALNTAGEQVRSYARTAQAQMQAIMEAFARDVDRLGSTPRSGDSTDATRHPNDPPFDDVSDPLVRFRTGSRPDFPSSY
jgi:cell division septum initiation protein DivIVA